jgi:hypothetical protein
MIKLSTLVVCGGLVALASASNAQAPLNPCTLLTTADVQRVLPGVKPGELDRTQEKQGVLTCRWGTAGGGLTVVTGAEIVDSVKEEAEGWTLTFLDPLRSDAQKHVRYETLSGVGDGAVAVVERQDKAKGFAQDGAILVVRRGKHQVSLVSVDIARRERAEALRALGELGKTIAQRLN